MIVNITKQEAKDIKKIRNYFGENDKTIFEHMAYSVLDGLVKNLAIADVTKVKVDLVCDCTKQAGSLNLKTNEVTCWNCGAIRKKTD